MHCSISFWGMYNFSEKNINFLEFNLLLSYWGVYFFMCDLIAPHDCEKITSWKDHFLKIRGKYWVCHMVLANLIFSHFYFIEGFRDNSLIEIFLGAYLPWLSISIIGFYFSSLKIQGILITIMTLMIFMNGVFTLFSEAEGHL